MSDQIQIKIRKIIVEAFLDLDDKEPSTDEIILQLQNSAITYDSAGVQILVNPELSYSVNIVKD